MNVIRMKNAKFKTNEIAVFLTMPLKRETITMNALLPAILRRGTSNYINQVEIGKQLENMYGAFFNCGVDKTGNYCILKFYIEVLSNKFLPNGENLSQQAMELISDIIYNPFVENNAFKKDYVEQEKNNLKKIIESKKDNKEMYAFNRCIEEMFKGDPYGIDKSGYLEDLKSINENSLYEYYKKMIETAEISVVINGADAETVKIRKQINEGKQTKLKTENSNAIIAENVRTVKEKADVTQGKLIIGMNTPSKNKFAVTLYNAVLGGGANSKLFQNVREKASLAYSAGSKYLKRKDAIFIVTGIELQNYEKALKIIQQQIDDMKNGIISDDEFEKAKQLVISSYELLKESQEDLITFYFDQKLFKDNFSIDEYIKEIQKVTKKQITEVANKIKLNTIYYLEK